MVDWDRVQELRSKGWDWGEIAKDPAVDFHPDARAGSPARALRALYHRTGRRTPSSSAATNVSKRTLKEQTERKWTLTRVGYLAVPVVGVWSGLAYAAPSPVGLLVPAIPYLALALAVVAFVLIYALWRKTDGPRWSSVYRATVVSGVVLGLIVAGSIGLAGALIFGCPYLPPASSLSTSGASGWATGALPAWQAGGGPNGKVPVVFFYGATWCPYCSASSWAMYKALTEYASVTVVGLSHSSLSDVYPGTPEVILAGATLSPKNGHGPGVALEVAEDTSGVDGTYPGTASCYQQAYVTAYASGIPFYVVNGQAIHTGTLVDPNSLTPWNYASAGANGATQVQSSVLSESGQPWSYVQGQAYWMMAYLAKYIGTPVATLASEYGWSTATTNAVTADLALIS